MNSRKDTILIPRDLLYELCGNGLTTSSLKVYLYLMEVLNSEEYIVVTQAEITEATGVQQSGVSLAITQLSRKDLILRDGSDKRKLKLDYNLKEM